MRLYEVVGLLSRRLGVKPGRVQAVAGRLQDAGILRKCEGSRRFPIDVGEPEVAALLVAIMGENGIGTAKWAMEQFGALSTADGLPFSRFISELLFGEPLDVRHILVRQAPAGISAVVGGELRTCSCLIILFPFCV